MSEIKKTPFYKIHLDNKAKIVEFAGYWMPIQFKGIMEEHRRVRSTVGLFDITHMGEFEVRGKDSLAFLQKMTTNDVSRLSDYQVQYSSMCYDDGGIVDDLLVYKLPDRFFLVVNAANIEKDFNWLKSHLFGDVKLEDLSDQTSLLAIQGPVAEKVMAKLTTVDLKKLQFYWAAKGKVAGKEILFSRTGYTGEDGFELYMPNEYGKHFWNAIMQAGKEFGMEPIGLGARDSLRLEMKYMLYGNDIDKTTNPLEAGLGWVVKLDKGDYIGKEPILKLKETGIRRKLVAFELSDKAFPRQHYPIEKDGKKIGEVTSGTFSPSLERGIGLGYVEVGYSEIGTKLEINIRGKSSAAMIIKPPFYKNYTHK